MFNLTVCFTWPEVDQLLGTHHADHVTALMQPDIFIVTRGDVESQVRRFAEALDLEVGPVQEFGDGVRLWILAGFE